MRASIDENRQVPEDNKAKVAGLLLGKERCGSRDKIDALGYKQHMKKKLIIMIEKLRFS